MESVQKVLGECLADQVVEAQPMAEAMVGTLGKVGVKAALRLAERSVFTAGVDADGAAQLSALQGILDDLAGDEALASKECEII